MDPSKKTKLNLLVDQKTDRVLFARAGKDAVDFFYSLLEIPLGAAALRPLSAEENMTAGCPSELRESLLDLDSAHHVHGKPSFDSLSAAVPSSSQSPAGQKYYRCSDQRPNAHEFNKYHWMCCIPKYTSTQCTGDHLYLTDACGTVCPSCRQVMTTEMTVTHLADAGEHTASEGTHDKDRGYVKGGAVYMVMDDLGVTPIGSVSESEALDKLGVVDLSSLYELTVELGPAEGLQLLKTSLCSSSQTVLTDVFLRKQEGGRDPSPK